MQKYDSRRCCCRENCYFCFVVFGGHQCRWYFCCPVAAVGCGGGRTGKAGAWRAQQPASCVLILFIHFYLFLYIKSPIHVKTHNNTTKINTITIHQCSRIHGSRSTSAIDDISSHMLPPHTCSSTRTQTDVACRHGHSDLEVLCGCRDPTPHRCTANSLANSNESHIN